MPRKLFVAVMSRKEQANLQLILNKEEDGVRLTNFLTNCLQNQKIIGKGFKAPLNIFQKSDLSFRADYIYMLIN